MTTLLRTFIQEYLYFVLLTLYKHAFVHFCFSECLKIHIRFKSFIYYSRCNLLTSPGRSLPSWLQKTRLSVRATHLSVCDHLKRANQPLPCSGAARTSCRGPRAMCDTCLIKLSLEKLFQETRGDRRQPCSNFSLFSPLIGHGVNWIWECLRDRILSGQKPRIILWHKRAECSLYWTEWFAKKKKDGRLHSYSKEGRNYGPDLK